MTNPLFVKVGFFACFFFFKQKTAYEIGLGIPAEPLFRSDGHKAASSRTSEAALWPSTYISPLSNSTPCRSEERRVGKEGRFRWATRHERKRMTKMISEEGATVYCTGRQVMGRHGNDTLSA